jgi:type II secretory pathway pseudopilin PulG
MPLERDMKKLRTQFGFSMLELAVAIAVAGLLIGGVIAGRQLMDSGKATSVVSDTEEVQRAVAQFVKTYNAMPGDMQNASTRLGSFPGGIPATFNGNGNGEIDNNDERQAVWQHLALAGLIKGQYDPTATTPGTGLKTSKFGRDVGMQVQLVGNQVMIEHSRFEGGTGGHGFLTPEEARRLDQKYDDGNPATGRMMALNGTGGTCLSGGTGFNTANKGRDCYLRVTASALDQNDITVATLDDADANPSDTSTSILKCANNLDIGDRIQFDCPENAAQKYFKICRKDGILEIDPNDYDCAYPSCPTSYFNDRNGHPVYFSSATVGETRGGICATATGNPAQATYRWGYDDGGNIQKASPYPMPALKCLSPGGSEGWHYTDNLQHMSGYCDTICRFSQITGNVTKTPEPMDAWLNTNQITARNNRARIRCMSGFSDPSRAETAVEVSGESDILTCSATEGTGYTGQTLNCLPDCSIAGTPGWVAGRMTATLFSGSAADLATNIRNSSTVSVTCATGYSWGASSTVSWVRVQCSGAGGTRTITTNNGPVATLPTCFANCPSAATSGSNFYSPMTLPGGAAPGTTLHGTTQTITCNNTTHFGSVSVPNPSTIATCNNGSWNVPSLPACYPRCSTPTARAGASDVVETCCNGSQRTRTCGTTGSWSAASPSSCPTCTPPCASNPIDCGNCQMTAEGKRECAFGCGWKHVCAGSVNMGGCDPGYCSDNRLKQDIRLVGYKGNIPVYHFSYRNDPTHTRYEGVMAQDVSHIPGAVNLGSERCGGYMSVNYDAIGVTFKRLD